MTREEPGRLAQAIDTLGMDWTDWAAVLGMVALAAGAWLTWSLGVALIIVGAVLVVAVAAITLRATAEPTSKGR